MHYRGVRLGSEMAFVALALERISKTVLRDTTKDLLTGVIRALCATKEI